jgi:hypothetical protein
MNGEDSDFGGKSDDEVNQFEELPYVRCPFSLKKKRKNNPLIKLFHNYYVEIFYIQHFCVKQEIARRVILHFFFSKYN